MTSAGLFCRQDCVLFFETVSCAPGCSQPSADTTEVHHTQGMGAGDQRQGFVGAKYSTNEVSHTSSPLEYTESRASLAQASLELLVI